MSITESIDNTPGLGSTSFKVKLNVNWFKYKPIKLKTPIITRLKKFFGFFPTYKMIVIGKPIQEELGWNYPIKIKTKCVRVFGIIVKRINYE